MGVITIGKYEDMKEGHGEEWGEEVGVPDAVLSEGAGGEAVGASSEPARR